MEEREKLKSRLGFILLSAGCAIGIGNVWKFPYTAGQGGGGAFVLFYLLFLIILGLPIMTMEFAVGRASQKSPVKAACKRLGITYSISSCKSFIHNAYMLERFICVFGINPDMQVIDKLFKELILFTARAA